MPPAATFTRLVPTSSCPPPTAAFTRRLPTSTLAGNVAGRIQAPPALTVTAGDPAIVPLVFVSRLRPDADPMASDDIPSTPPESVTDPMSVPEPLTVWPGAIT